jgi:signal transduction histidine kinase
VGILAGWGTALGITWLVVAFPGARPRGAAWGVLSLAVATFVLGALPVILTSPTIHALPAVGRCTTACPANAALVVDAPSVAHAFRLVEASLQALWGAALLGYVILHFVRASRPRRRLLAPLYAVMVPFVAVFATIWTVEDLGGVQPSIGFRAVAVGLRIAAPLGFIAALLFARSYAGEALAFMTARLVGQPSVAAVEQLVRRVLDDAHARLAFWLPRHRKFVDRHGKPVDLELAEEGISWQVFPRAGDPVLAILHDGVMSEDTELVEAVGAATMLALEKRRLYQDLIDSVQALRASQQRLVSASSAERRNIERNLHDGVQQKLVALRIQLELALDLAEGDPGLTKRLAALGSDLEDALEELRAVAHGIYPPLLSDEGLTAALREAARRSTVPITVGVEDVGRLSEECETAVYYCCLEALQNVTKHGGEHAVACLRLWRDGRAVCFSVVDDGVGFVPTRGRAGSGLMNMSDRIGAVGGALVIRSAPGEGTTVEGRVAVETRELAQNDLLRI